MQASEWQVELRGFVCPIWSGMYLAGNMLLEYSIC